MPAFPSSTVHCRTTRIALQFALVTALLAGSFTALAAEAEDEAAAQAQK